MAPRRHDGSDAQSFARRFQGAAGFGIRGQTQGFQPGQGAFEVAAACGPEFTLENMAKIILVTGSMVGFAYFMEFFIAWYSGNQYEAFTLLNRAVGPYAWAYWTMVT